MNLARGLFPIFKYMLTCRLGCTREHPTSLMKFFLTSQLPYPHLDNIPCQMYPPN